MAAEGTNKAIGANVGTTKASLGKRTIVYKGSDTTVSASFGGMSTRFTRGVPREVPATLAESLLKQPAKFTADLAEKIDAVVDPAKAKAEADKRTAATGGK
jgi:hypothetical protein